MIIQSFLAYRLPHQLYWVNEPVIEKGQIRPFRVQRIKDGGLKLEPKNGMTLKCNEEAEADSGITVHLLRHTEGLWSEKKLKMFNLSVNNVGRAPTPRHFNESPQRLEPGPLSLPNH